MKKEHDYKITTELKLELIIFISIKYFFGINIFGKTIYENQWNKIREIYGAEWYSVCYTCVSEKLRLEAHTL